MNTVSRSGDSKDSGLELDELDRRRVLDHDEDEESLLSSSSYFTPFPPHDTGKSVYKISVDRHSRQMSCHNTMAANTMGNSTVQSMAISVMSSSKHILNHSCDLTPAYPDFVYSSGSEETLQLNSSPISTPEPEPTRPNSFCPMNASDSSTLQTRTRRRQRRSPRGGKDAAKYSLVFGMYR